MAEQPQPETTGPEIATGRSRKGSFSIQEAFDDALAQLRRPPNHTDELSMFGVVEVGAEIGGVVGLENATVTLRRLDRPSR